MVALRDNEQFLVLVLQKKSKTRNMVNREYRMATTAFLSTTHVMFMLTNQTNAEYKRPQLKLQ